MEQEKTIRVELPSVSVHEVPDMLKPLAKRLAHQGVHFWNVSARGYPPVAWFNAGGWDYKVTPNLMYPERETYIFEGCLTAAQVSSVAREARRAARESSGHKQEDAYAFCDKQTLVLRAQLANHDIIWTERIEEDVVVTGWDVGDDRWWFVEMSDGSTRLEHMHVDYDVSAKEALATSAVEGSE